ncbi:MAG TPA: UDP-N-acetylmuramoyl-L-alanyl-D-glutamate--2,6-diaminopimelate ligase [Clostridiaceae bacterium]|jgi:UDP-N-acetylmuramoyl-L-alanyl-D-glutamate--2,6-diaminopimelate ligase|nr:UDP-N-acetylmuramoyl-L-alanyl-D-glutamate--2,6-diaminopimelate ligase [Clostridiaceae bacterium]
MELKKILAGLEGLKVKGSLDLDINNLDSDSRNINDGDMFVAIKGFDVDGHEYIKEAIGNGAKVILAQINIDRKFIKEIPDDVTIILSENTRHALAICACNFYGNPSKKVKLIGITGTKGKTTTSFMTKAILEKEGKKVGLIGTIACYIGSKKLEDSDRTTPESLKLQKIFKQMVDEGCEVIVMEVSSQSLKLHRVDGCVFDIAVFTNFSEDHISEKEHPDMEDYFNSKLKLFHMCKTGYVNADDLHTAKIPKMLPDNDISTYGIDNYCNLLAKDITITNSYVDFKVKLGQRNERVKTFIPGRFSVYNSLAAICVGLKLGCSAENIKEALLEVRVPGRSELVDNKKDLTIMIDYAHSPESLENILNAVKSYTRGRVISVFGCGGDRDPGKRPIMGEISGKIADYTIITSDNPRTEDPEKIVNQIEEGIKKTNGKYECIVDRIEAIKSAVEMANKNDIVVLAGKGHETYQIIGHKKYPFDEKEIIKEIIDGQK